MQVENNKLLSNAILFVLLFFHFHSLNGMIHADWSYCTHPCLIEQTTLTNASKLVPIPSEHEFQMGEGGGAWIEGNGRR